MEHPDQGDVLDSAVQDPERQDRCHQRQLGILTLPTLDAADHPGETGSRVTDDPWEVSDRAGTRPYLDAGASVIARRSCAHSYDDGCPPRREAAVRHVTTPGPSTACTRDLVSPIEIPAIDAPGTIRTEVGSFRCEVDACPEP